MGKIYKLITHMLNMKVKLDIKDKKILELLEQNSRLSNSQIARKVKLSKPAVEYRLKRFERNKLIFSFQTAIDFTKLGYSQYKTYFKFQNATPSNEKEIIDYWKKSKNVIWIAEIRGNWDLSVSILAKSNFEFGQILNKFMNSFSQFILKKDVLLTEYSPYYAVQHQKKGSEFVYGKPAETYKIDEIDSKILKILSTDARISILDLAKKTKLSRDIVNYRIKKLLKNEIIVQYKLIPDFDKLGFFYYKVIFRTKNLNEKEQKRLENYLVEHKKAKQLLKLIGSWDFEIEFEVDNEDELYKVLNELRKEFSNIIRDFSIIRVKKTHKFNYFPF